MKYAITPHSETKPTAGAGRAARVRCDSWPRVLGDAAHLLILARSSHQPTIHPLPHASLLSPPSSSFSFFLSTCHSLHCAVSLHFPFMCVRTMAASALNVGDGACSPERAPKPGPGTCDATTVLATLAMLPVTCGGVHYATKTRH
jgi:hypothetical protein